jgi:hypothetical protein
VTQLQGCQVSFTSRCPDSTNSTGVWKPLEMPDKNVYCLSQGYLRKEYHLGNIGTPVDEDHEVPTRPLVHPRWPTKASFQRFQYARRYNHQIRDTSHRVDSRRGNQGSVTPSLQCRLSYGLVQRLTCGPTGFDVCRIPHVGCPFPRGLSSPNGVSL